MKKRILSLIIILAMLTVFVPYIHAAEIVNEGVCGNFSEGYVTWVLDDAGTLIISGEGTVEPNFTGNKGEYIHLEDKVKTVVIEKGVKSIGNGAFSFCRGLKSIIMPDSIGIIGTEAFRECESLTSIIIPNGVAWIKDRAFYQCISLENITVPNSVVLMGKDVFEGWGHILSSTTRRICHLLPFSFGFIVKDTRKDL